MITVPAEQPSNRLAAFDLLRVLACFAVIVVHISTGVIFYSPSADNFVWWVGDFYDAAMRWCVPVFIMLTGALLIPKTTGITVYDFWRKRLARILWPALFWSGFYVLLPGVVTHDLEKSGLLLSAMGGKPFYHLWYLYLAILLYLLLPLVAHFSKRQAYAAIILSFAVSTIAGWPGFEGRYIVLTIFAYASYLALGHLLANMPRCSKTEAVFYLAGAFLCWLIMTQGAAALLARIQFLGWEYLFSFSNVLVAIMAICIFRICMSVDVKLNLAPLAKLTLGIYAIHPVWVVALNNLGINGFSFGPALGIPLVSILVFALSAGTAYVISQIGLLRAVVS